MDWEGLIDKVSFKQKTDRDNAEGILEKGFQAGGRSVNGHTANRDSD